MKTERYYTAFCDDGHDFFDFEFCSEHRANSKENFEDAKREYRHKYGCRAFRILKVQLNNF